MADSEIADIRSQYPKYCFIHYFIFGVLPNFLNEPFFKVKFLGTLLKVNSCQNSLGIVLQDFWLNFCSYRICKIVEVEHTCFPARDSIVKAYIITVT